MRKCEQQLISGIKMTNYYISETQNAASFRQAFEIKADSLESARRVAEDCQVFQGTVVSVGRGVNEEGFILNPVCQLIDDEWVFNEA